MASTKSVGREALIIGIDFGTTFSGVAWCYSGDPESIKTIKNWPGGGTQNYDKVQTTLSYNQKDPSRYKWGYEVNDDDAHRLSWFKLLLDQGQGDSSSQIVNRSAPYALNNRKATGSTLKGELHHLEATVAAIPRGKGPLDLVTDYLSSIHKHTTTILERTYPLSVTEQFGKQTPIKYCLTVPAVWSDKAKELTKQAARRAGMCELSSEIRLITEPEAAAIHCLQKFQDTSDCLKVGDIYVITDCGGGTVDLITYEITAITPNLQVKECATGDGGLCGSTTLNGNFEELVKARMGLRGFENLEPHARRVTLNHFDQYLKVKFTDVPNEGDDDDEDEDEDEKFFCPVPGAPDDRTRGIKGGFLVISKEEMKGIFLPIFGQIEALINNQVKTAEKRSNRSVTGILLVGGFGSSEYLHGHLSSRIRSREGSLIKILQPPDAWTAIVRGAVIDTLSLHQSSQKGASDTAMIRSRIARFSYGTTIHELFDPKVHQVKNRFYCKLRGQYRANNCMNWLVKKGHEIPSREPIRKDVQLTREFTQALEYQEKVFCSSENSPPDTYDEGNGIFELCQFTAQIPKTMHTSSNKKVSDNGTWYWCFPFQACLQYDSELVFSSKEVGTDRDIGKVTVEYSHDLPLRKYHQMY
ncbi:hypothetical protein DFH27DRAFT_127268 [Peziza echinospora]|nr:hypothetical protein DFH27DRAFT_127268 [Peziza echinospora]